MRASLSGRPLGALLLDLDDTILDDGAGYEEAWTLAADMLVARYPALHRDGVFAEIDRCRTHFWDDPDRHQRGRLDLTGARTEILTAVLESLGQPDPEIAREAGRAYTELRDRHQRLLPGARAALERLRGMVPVMALVSNGASVPQRAKLDRFDLEPFFDHIQIEGEFGIGKPDSAVYRHVLARLGVGPEECLMVGDNFEADVLGAQSVGIHAAWMDLKGSGKPPRATERPHWTVRSLEELTRRLLP